MSSRLSALKAFSTCEVSDALLKLGVANGGYIPDLDSHGTDAHLTGTVVGTAYTVKMVSGADTTAPKLDKGHFIDLAPTGSVLCISAPPFTKNASLGGLLAAGAVVKGVQGAVINGRCRDLGELRELKFPVFSRGHSTLGQSPFTRVSEVNVPISFDPVPNATMQSASLRISDVANFPPFPPVTITPGDIVMADVDGVVVFGPQLLDDVLEVSSKLKEIDAKCLKDILAGKTIKETFKLHRGK